MSLLDYLLYEQCSSQRFGPIVPEYLAPDDSTLNKNYVNDVFPMGCCLSKVNSYKRSVEEEKEDLLNTAQSQSLIHQYDPWGSPRLPPVKTVDGGQDLDLTNVFIVDLRNDLQPLHHGQGGRITQRTSECQTEPVEGVDFDWDLTDKTDIETQTSPPSRAQSSKPEPSDAIVQTDQRIVFPGSGRQSVESRGRRVTFTEEEDISTRNNWCQTSWDTIDIAVQVLPDDLDSGDGDEWTGWRRNGQPAVNTATQVVEADQALQVDFVSHRGVAAGVESQDHSSPVGVSLHKSLHLDDDLDEPLDNVIQKSSIANGMSMKIQSGGKRTHSKVDVGIQTEKEIVVAAMNGFGVLPPLQSKASLIGDDPLLFMRVDDHVTEVSRKWYKSIKKLVRHLLQVIDEVPEYVNHRELISVRAIYTWVTENIRYDPSFLEHQMSTIDILRYRAGVCRDYVKIFSEMCILANINVQIIQGFARKTDFRPGEQFDVDSEKHAWTAVYIDGSWRIVDPTFGSGWYHSKSANGYVHSPDDFYFLVDPYELIYTHFPYNQGVDDYSAWQLLPHPLSLDQFNAVPYLSSHFFKHGLELLTDVPIPWIIQDSGTIHIKSLQVIRFKFKLYVAGEKESEKLNNFCLAELEGMERLHSKFLIRPPFLCSLIFKIYGKPENEIVDSSTRLDHVASFLIQAKRVLPQVQPWPQNDVSWGLTSDYFKLGCVLVIDDPHKWEGNKIVMVVGAKAVFKFLHKEGPLMAASHLYDHKGNELIEEVDNHGKGTLFLLSKKHPLPSAELRMRQEAGELKAYVSTKVTKTESLFTVICPPHVGYYKLDIFAAKVPEKKGKLELPLVASFMVEVRLKSLFGGVTTKTSIADLLVPPAQLRLPPINERSRNSSQNSGESEMYRQAQKSSKLKMFQRADNPRSSQSSSSNRNSIFSLSKKFSIVPESVISSSSNEGRY